MMYTFFMKKKNDLVPFKKRNFYDISDTGIVYLSAIIAPYLIMALVIVFFGLISSQTGTTMQEFGDSLAYKIISCFFAPLGLCILFFSYNKIKKTSFKAINLKPKMQVWDFVMCFVVALVCLFGFKYFIGGIDHLLVLGGYELSSLSLPLDNVGWLVLAIFLLAVLPAVFEEFVYRGIIFNGLRSKMGDVSAIFVSAAMFAFMHGSIEQLVYQFFLGVVIAWMVVRTGSLLSGIIIHFLNNAMVVILAYIELHYGGVEMTYNVWQWVLSVGLVLVCLAIIFVIEKFYFKHKNHEIVEKNDEEDQLTEKQKLKEKTEKTQDLKNLPYPILLWISMGISFVLFLINTLTGFGAL